MAAPWTPRIVYGGTTLNFSLPTRRWIPKSNSIGGSEVMANREPAAYVVRRDAILSVVFRVLESEWSSFLTWLKAAQEGELTTFYPDVATLGTNVDCYVDHPTAGEPISPKPDENEPSVFEVEVDLRRADDQEWSLQWYT